MSVIILFDIDMTMIRTNRVGATAMAETLHEMLGIVDGFALIDFAGRTDRAILREVLTLHGRMAPDFEGFVRAFEERYIVRLTAVMQERGGVVLPGVREALRALAALPDLHLGLATGNFRRAAEIKLRHFGLWHHFLDGGFADDAEQRDALVATAIQRMAAHCARAPQAVIVVGDSVHDVTAARANGATAVAVATGATSAESLAAAGADIVLDNLADPALLQLVHALRL